MLHKADEMALDQRDTDRLTYTREYLFWVVRGKWWTGRANMVGHDPQIAYHRLPDILTSTDVPRPEAPKTSNYLA